MKIALYSGMRISEILSLKKSDIKNEFIIINKGKTENAKRKIPIHPKLKHIIENYDFSILVNGSVGYHIKKINKQINTIIPDKSKTFHCLRKNFVQSLYSNKISPDTIKVIIGHSTNSDLTFTAYNLGKVNDSDLIEAVSMVSFDLPCIEDVGSSLKVDMNIDLF